MIAADYVTEGTGGHSLIAHGFRGVIVTRVGEKAIFTKYFISSSVYFFIISRWLFEN